MTPWTSAAAGIATAATLLLHTAGLVAAHHGMVPGLKINAGAVNGAVIERAGRRLVVYGDPGSSLRDADTVLFTHARRDVVWAGRALVEGGAKAVVPAKEAGLFKDPAGFWAGFGTARFHDYAQQSTKVPGSPLAVSRTVQGGDTLEWEGLAFRVLDTPGYTRGAVTYVLELDGHRIAFTGDLICGDGRLWDLYSLQDAIPEAKIGGYHGYAARLADVLASLARVASAQPEILVPARGPVIRDPAAAIDRATRRIRAVYANCLEIDALRWYFGDDHVRAKARRVLGPEARINWMETAETIRKTLPAWIVPIANARLILAADGAGFMVDCGSASILNELEKRHREGRLASVDHVFVTHYHDDHTEAVPDLVQAFGSTVYACPQMVDILERPRAYRLPAMTARSIPVAARLADGARWRWKEFELTAWFFPGQTLYHQALLVRKDAGESICFIGDSFTPTGPDDYCLPNRNWLHPGHGYFACLDRLQQLPPDCLLINQHVAPAFRFSPAQIDQMKRTLQQRLRLLRDLIPWDDPNFALDEGWARIRPYAATTRPRGVVSAAVVIFNHSPAPQTFRVRLNLPAGWTAARAPRAIHLPPRQEGAVHFAVTVPEHANGLHVVTADVAWAGADLREWSEMMVTVEGALHGRGD
ncbi:MAG: MBL fold metallo-hydrolase [Verrucomicrobia bacterium]|nr:MBL fold metallo-hydrolase [Verrucomicrobiota bacterium]